MFDYVQLFCDLVEAGNDMKDVVWDEFQEAAAQSIYDSAELGNVDKGDLH